LAAHQSPDVFVIVLDAVRGSDLYSGSAGTISSLPFLSRFSREAAIFPQAVAAASWTVPSVASLITGLYPWEHGASALGTNRLDPRFPTLASTLRARGYLTLLLSANSVVGPRTNLSAGFEHTFVADWWEQYLRLRRATPSTSGSTVGGDASEGPANGYTNLLRLGSRRAMRAGFRYTGLLEKANRFAQGLKEPAHPLNVRVSPWIEPTFDRVLATTSRSRPVFSFIHLNDAHEPYYRTAPRFGLLSGSREPTVRQDYMRQVEGTWSPTPRELGALHALYQTMIREIDGRIETLVRTISEHRDINNSMVLITADHGQAFGEGGWLFHMCSPEEALLRIPLIVRFPGGILTGIGKGWTSPVDVAPTIFESIGVPSPLQGPGLPVQHLLDEERASPVWALGDGLPIKHLEGIVSVSGDPRWETAHRLWLAAYYQSTKLTFDLRSRATTVQGVEVRLGSEYVRTGEQQDAQVAQIRAEAARLAYRIMRDHDDQESGGVSKRLESWGYGV